MAQDRERDGFQLMHGHAAPLSVPAGKLHARVTMTIANYLWTVARALRAEVYDGTAAGAPREALDHCLSVLTTLANALERKAPEALPGTGDPGEPVDLLQIGPPENAAAYAETGARIAAAARGLDDDPASLGRARAAVAWEKALLDAAVQRMDGVNRPVEARAEDPRLQISTSALQRFLRDRLAAPDLRIEAFRTVPGGRSRQTGLFSVADVPASVVRELVVQRALPGLVSGPAFATVGAQYEVLKAMHAAGLKVPKPLAVDTGSDVLGAAFIVVERSPGKTVEPDYWRVPSAPSLALDLAEQMGRLHAQPISELGPMLPQARSRYDRAGWAEELEQLAALWFREAHWPSVTMSGVIAWLRAHIDCVEDRRSLVHNDMVFHNILGQDDRITAILDWEQVSVGHPGEDLGYCYPVVSAMTDWDRFMDAYTAAGGQRVPQVQVDFFALRGLLRLMGLVMLGGRNAFEQGHNDGVLVASAGCYFTQRLLHKTARVLESVLARG